MKKNIYKTNEHFGVKHIHRWSNWWKVKADNSMERLCLVCGEIQSAGKVNRVIMGWALSNRKNGISCHNAQMPIYWNRKVAQKHADEWGEKLKQVKIVIY